MPPAMPSGPRSAFGLILLGSLLLRLPFFFQAVIDWDESTFILIGQALLDGHLPYTHLWDLKPPLLFAAFAGAIALFGDSIAGIRLFGAICVTATAWFVYLLTARWGSAIASWFAAGLCVAALSLMGSGQATMSEHVALPLLTGAVLLWTRGPQTAGRAFWVGALVAAAALVRLNLGLVAPVFAVLVFVEARRHGVAWRAVWACAAGGLAVLAATSLSYLWQGQFHLLWTSVVSASLARSGSDAADGGLSDLFSALARGGSGGGVLWIGVLLWACALLGGWTALVRTSGAAQWRTEALRVLVMAAAVVLSVACSGGAYPHYWLQLVPFAAVLAGARIADAPARTQTLVCGLALVLLVASGRSVAGGYWRMAQSVVSGQPLTHGAAVEIADYLRKEGAAGEPVLMLREHIGHWLLKTEPPVGLLTHPSILIREQVLHVLGTTPSLVIESAFRHPPRFVVFEAGDWFLEGAAGDALARELAVRYVLVAEIQGRQIHRLRDW